MFVQAGLGLRAGEAEIATRCLSKWGSGSAARREEEEGLAEEAESAGLVPGFAS